jgi:hypothetical protein
VIQLQTGERQRDFPIGTNGAVVEPSVYKAPKKFTALRELARVHERIVASAAG